MKQLLTDETKNSPRGVCTEWTRHNEFLVPY